MFTDKPPLVCRKALLINSFDYPLDQSWRLLLNGTKTCFSSLFCFDPFTVFQLTLGNQYQPCVHSTGSPLKPPRWRHTPAFTRRGRSRAKDRKWAMRLRFRIVCTKIKLLNDTFIIWKKKHHFPPPQSNMVKNKTKKNINPTLKRLIHFKMIPPLDSGYGQTIDGQTKTC